MIESSMLDFLKCQWRQWGMWLNSSRNYNWKYNNTRNFIEMLVAHLILIGSPRSIVWDTIIYFVIYCLIQELPHAMETVAVPSKYSFQTKPKMIILMRQELGMYEGSCQWRLREKMQQYAIQRSTWFSQTLKSINHGSKNTCRHIIYYCNRLS